jgi:hypothetical protein
MFLPDEAVHAALAAVTNQTRWCGLSTTEPVLQADGTYTNVTEPAVNSYARVQVPASDWSAPADRFTQCEVLFADPVDDYGVVVAWVHFDAATGGTADLAGVTADGTDLVAGTSNVTVICRIDAPDTDY